MTSFGVRLAPRAAKRYSKLGDTERARVRKALVQLGVDTAAGRRGGKRVKTIRGSSYTFHRLRVGELRILFDVLDEEGIVLVLDIVPRKDLERWLRNR